MAVQLTDMYTLSQDVLFQNRVQMALIQTCVQIIALEPEDTEKHAQREQLVLSMITSTDSLTNYTKMMAYAVATDTTTINAATSNGTISLNSGNADSQQAAIPDSAITTALGNFLDTFVQR
jgi:hypothetical protein